MIESSFGVLSGVGEKTERPLWQGGVGTWTESPSGPAPSWGIKRYMTLP